MVNLETLPISESYLIIRDVLNVLSEKLINGITRQYNMHSNNRSKNLLILRIQCQNSVVLYLNDAETRLLAGDSGAWSL